MLDLSAETRHVVAARGAGKAGLPYRSSGSETGSLCIPRSTGLDQAGRAWWVGSFAEGLHQNRPLTGCGPSGKPLHFLRHVTPFLRLCVT